MSPQTKPRSINRQITMQLPPLTPGRLIRRYKRFLADIELEDGTIVTAHCPNPGSMMGLKHTGARAWVSQSDNPKRKLPYTLELVEADGTLVAINTQNPNKLAEEAIRRGDIARLSTFETLRREVPYGKASRVDLLLETGEQKTFVEVKNCHLMRKPGLAEFPDSVTQRGLKHLHDLTNMVQSGYGGVMLFIIQRGDCTAFETAEDLDPAYHAGLANAAEAGVEILCYDCQISVEKINVRRALPWRDSKDTFGARQI